jgi:hypothetical protein
MGNRREEVDPDRIAHQPQLVDVGAALSPQDSGDLLLRHAEQITELLLT